MGTDRKEELPLVPPPYGDDTYKMSRATSKYRVPPVLCGGRKEKNVRILKIKTKTGIKTVYNVIDWGWNAETGDLYYRSGKELHHKRCISVEEIIV